VIRGRKTFVVAGSIAVVGVIGTVVVGAIGGMHPPDLKHLLGAVAAGAGITIVALLILTPLLAKTSLRRRLVAVALVAAIAAVVNLAILTAAMAVDDHDAALVLALLVYAAAISAASALVLAQRSAEAVERLDDVAERFGTGELDVRVGPLDAGPELDTLARTLDVMAARLQAATDRERELEGTRRDLTVALSHDLRTPLASLRAMIEAIDDGIVDDPVDVRRYVSEMRRSADQLTRMVDDLFELTQLEAGALEMERRRARLDDVVGNAMAAVEAVAVAKRLALGADLGGAAATPCSPRLERVLQNLLSNAVRHTPADGTVCVLASLRGGQLSLAVEDTGEGIDPEDLSKVFDPFFRADPARSGPGSGLGLAIAKRIVELLGGTIHAERRLPSGSRVAVDLPV
jgi:signal transduction histidine kinase